MSGLVEVSWAIVAVPAIGVPSSHLSVASKLTVVVATDDAGLKATNNTVQVVEVRKVKETDVLPAAICGESAITRFPGPGSTLKPALGLSVSSYLDVAAATRKSAAYTGMLDVVADAEDPDAEVDRSTVHVP